MTIITTFGLFENNNNTPQANWLEAKRKAWSSDTEEILMFFNDGILGMIERLKEEFDDMDSPDEISDVYCECITDSIEKMIDSISSYSGDVSILSGVSYEYLFCLNMWLDTFEKMSDKYQDLTAIFKLGSVIFRSITMYFKTILSKRIEPIFNRAKLSLNIGKTELIEVLDDFKTNISNYIERIDGEKTFNNVNVQDKSIDELGLYPGDNIIYIKRDGKEGKAYISNNQESLESDKTIRIVSTLDGDVVVIDKTQISEILPKNTTVRAEVLKAVNTIKGDEVKLKKVKELLDAIKDI